MTEQFLLKRREEILAAWVAAIAAELRVVSLEHSALRDHVGEFLDELASWVARPTAARGARLRTAAGEHAVERLDRLYELPQLIDEFRLLRATVLRLLLGEEEAEQARTGVPCSPSRVDALARLNDGFDLAIAGAVERFAAERERRLSQLEGADDALRAREAFLRRVLDASPSMVFVKDLAGRFVLANEALARVYGTTPAGLIGKTDADFNPNAEEVAAFQRDDREVMTTRREKLIPEEPVRTAAGEERWFSTVKVPLVDDDGSCTRVLGVATDITDRRRAEEGLRHADRQKDQYLAMLAHELRNPLAAIASAAEVIRGRVTQGLSPDRALQILERQVRNSARLLEDLLDVSRITRGLLHLRCAPVALADVVASAVDAQRALIDAAGHRLEISVPREPVLVNGDATRLEQVVSNLLNNAAKYTPERGRIEVAVEPARDGEARIRVADSGPGIPPALLPKIFDTFVQGEQSLARTKGGLGLGLTLVRRLVELHGGSVEARSAGPGEGSEFLVRLPALAAIRPPARETGRGPEPAHPAVPGYRVLLVEDSYDAAELLCEFLASLGHEVTVVHDGEAALVAAERLQPEVVLLDIGLPGIDGLEVGRRLRARSWARAPILIAVSGYGREEDRKRSQELGFAAHVTKPFDLRALEDVLVASCAGARRGGSGGPAPGSMG